LKTIETATFELRHFLVHDSAACGHPLHVTQLHRRCNRLVDKRDVLGNHA
jgi:hypothetical protein